MDTFLSMVLKWEGNFTIHHVYIKIGSCRHPVEPPWNPGKNQATQGQKVTAKSLILWRTQEDLNLLPLPSEA